MRLAVPVEVEVGHFVEVGPLNVQHVFVHNLKGGCAVQHAHSTATQVGPIGGPLLGPHLFLVEVGKPHHAAIVGVVAADIGNFVAVVHTGNARHAHEVGHEQAHFRVTVFSAVLDVACPALELHVFVDVERAVGKPLRPTYTYLSAYVQGADLPPHTDRADCEFTVSLLVDKPAGSSWNIYVHLPKQPVKHAGRCDATPPLDECAAVDCEAGGVMLFQGTDHVHFRRTLVDSHYTVLLLHYCSA